MALAGKRRKLMQQFLQMSPASRRRLLEQRAHGLRTKNKVVGLLFTLVLVGVLLGAFYIQNKPLFDVFGAQEGVALAVGYRYPLVARLFGIDTRYSWGVGAAVDIATFTNTRCNFTRLQFRRVGEATRNGQSLCKGLTCACFITQNKGAVVGAAVSLTVAVLMLIISIVAAAASEGSATPLVVAAVANLGAQMPYIVQGFMQRATVFGNDYSCPPECCRLPDGSCDTGCESAELRPCA